MKYVQRIYYPRQRAEILNDEDLEDGEIFEDEESANAKNLKSNVGLEKIKVQATHPVAPPVQKKNLDSEKNHKSLILDHIDKPPREPVVPFLNKGKKRHYDSHEEDNRWKKDGKRNRKSHDLERDGERQGEEDEEMMLVIRGASPSKIEEEVEKWDTREEEMEREEVNRRPTRSYRGRGGVSRRGERSRGRGRGRANLRVGKRKRLERDTCQFFMQGRCHRGSDCPYSHDILPPRKPELCKFFMKDCCAKDDKCLYMHSEFPCKYFHTGLKCYANKKCKFNHGVLTDPLRNILAKHLDTAPKEILGEFPRRDGRDRDREDMRDRDMRRERDPRDMRGDSRDMRGDLRDMRGDPRDMRGDPRDVRGDPRDLRGESRDMRVDSRDMRGDSRDMRADSRDMRGDSRDMRVDSRDMRDLRDTRGDIRDARDSRGDLRDMRVDARDMRADARDIRGDSRDGKGDFRDIRSDPRDMRSDLRDSRDLRGGDMREYLKNKSERDRRIPSLFDIKVAIADDLRSSDGNHTPMPSPTQRSQDSTRSSDRDRDHHSPDRDREKDKEREREQEHERKKHDKSERNKERKAKKEKSREHRRERKERREKEREKRREHKDKTADKAADSMKSFELMSPTPEGETNITDVPISSDRMHGQDKRTTTLSEENSMFPEHLPKKQRELFLRIQQQQREAENSQASANDDDDEDKMAEENWYSSDEESAPTTTLPSILKNLAQPSGTTTTTSSTVASNSAVLPILNILAPAAAAVKSTDVNRTPSITSVIPANLDLTNLSSVLEALSNLQKINATNQSVTKQEEASNTTIPIVKPEIPPKPPTPEPPKPEPPRVRDPRLRAEGSATDTRRSSMDNYPTDVDLRLKAGGSSQPSTDVDLRSLPFKPVQHTAASEIEASLASHPPLPWHLAPITVVRADYASLQIQPRPGVNDPRLRWKMRSPADESSLPRDPRQRLLDEPRARQPLLATPDVPPSPVMSGPPPTPRYDEDHRPQLFRMDSDMRQFPPPTPRMEEEVYTPGPIRPMDPRQRNLGVDDPRRSHFPARPDDVDLRAQIPHRVPFVNYNN